MGVLVLVNPFWSVGVAPSITSGSGVYVLSGQDAALIRHALLAAAQGSYALTGEDVALSAAMAAEQGSYALSGQAAGFLRDLVLSAAQGSYALAGQAAGLARALTMAAAQGAYSLSGQDVAFSSGARLAPGAGSYVVTGQDIAFVRALLLGAAQGSYALSGRSAGLLRALSFAAGQGSYALSGQAAGLLRAVRMAGGQGSYALTGKAAGLLRALKVAMAQGSYTLSGKAATLTYTPVAITAPTFIGAGAVAGGDYGSTTAVAAHASGDLILVYGPGAGITGAVGTVTTHVTSPTGWPLKWAIATGTGQINATAGSDSAGFAVGWAILRGTPSSSPIDTYGADVDTATTSHTGSTMTTGQANDMCVQFSGGNITGAFSAWANASLDSITEGADANATGIAYGVKAAAGAVNATAWTTVNSKATNNMFVAIKGV